MNELFPQKTQLILKTRKKDWFDDLSSKEKQEIEIGLKQAENNEFISHEIVMSQFAKYH